MPGHREDELKNRKPQATLKQRLSKNPHPKGTELHEVYKRNVLTDAFYSGEIDDKEYGKAIKKSVRQEYLDIDNRKRESQIKLMQFKKEEPRAFESAVDMQVEADIKKRKMNNSYIFFPKGSKDAKRWNDLNEEQKKAERARLVKLYQNSPERIDKKWYMATFRVYESKDFSKYVKDEEYMNQADSSPIGGSSGPGKGWHGERMRHRDAAMKRRMN